MHGEFLVPIVIFLVIGIINVTAIYYRSKEKQMMIDRGLTTEQIQEFFKRKKYPNALMKIGIILFFFGLGLGTGLWLEDMHLNGKDYDNEFWIPFMIFTFTGIGFIVANFTHKFSDIKEE